jgi:hypothetical protein
LTLNTLVTYIVENTFGAVRDVKKQAKGPSASIGQQSDQEKDHERNQGQNIQSLHHQRQSSQ